MTFFFNNTQFLSGVCFVMLWLVILMVKIRTSYGALMVLMAFSVTNFIFGVLVNSLVKVAMLMVLIILFTGLFVVFFYIVSVEPQNPQRFKSVSVNSYSFFPLIQKSEITSSISSILESLILSFLIFLSMKENFKTMMMENLGKHVVNNSLFSYSLSDTFSMILISFALMLLLLLTVIIFTKISFSKSSSLRMKV